jgi:hypothetical protein
MRHGVTHQPAKELYSAEEFAKIIKRSSFTDREWCRLGRAGSSFALSAPAEPKGSKPAEELIEERPSPSDADSTQSRKYLDLTQATEDHQ